MTSLRGFCKRPATTGGAKALLLGCGLMLTLNLQAAEPTTPPSTELELKTSATGSTTLTAPGVSVAGGATRAASVSWLNRQAISAQGWYWNYGVQAENTFFTYRAPWPRRLQAYSGLLGLEYFVNGENVAALALHPGWYFENHPTGAAWDVPVDLTVGWPVTDQLSGVTGFSNGRFYHHAVPIIGLVWTVTPRVRGELVYPEPAVVFTLDANNEFRLGGELVGGGYLSDPQPARTVVEYSSYRVGVQWTHAWPTGYKLALATGVEAERSLDFFRQQGRLHGSGAAYVEVHVSFARR